MKILKNSIRRTLLRRPLHLFRGVSIIRASIVNYFVLDCSRDECHGLDRHAHFENFGYAMLTLFRISTGDNWSGVFKVNDMNTFINDYQLDIIVQIYRKNFYQCCYRVWYDVGLYIFILKESDSKKSWEGFSNYILSWRY